MKDYYVSYSHHDEETARWVSYQISMFGFSTILNPWDYLPGEDFLAKMREAAPYCKKIVILVSERALPDILSSDTTKRQFLLGASGLEKKSIIVRLDPCEIEAYFKRFRYIDLVNLSENEARERLLSGLRPRQPQQERIPLPPPFRGITRRPLPEHADISSKTYSKAQIMNLREEEYENNLKILLQNNYHMQLSLEKEVKKETEIVDEATGEKNKKRKICLGKNP